MGMYDAVASMFGGVSFIAPEDIASIDALDASYTLEHLNMLYRTLPEQRQLEQLSATHVVCAPPPVYDHSTMTLKKLFPRDFFSGPECWYAYNAERFSRFDIVGKNWLIMKREPLPQSLDKSFMLQQALLSPNEFLLNAAQTLWVLLAFRKFPGNSRLLESKYIRTSSVDSFGDRVGVGGADDSGIGIGTYVDTFGFKSLGIAPAITPIVIH